MLLEHPRILIATDDIYEKIYWGSEPFCSLLTAVPALYDRTVTINGCSKGYAMTGWRIGYCGGPKEIVAAMATVQGQSTTNASSISQKAAIAALNGPEDEVRQMNAAFKERHDYFVAGLNALPGVSCLPGSGTFYAFADVRQAMQRLGLQGRQRVLRIHPGRSTGRRCSRFRIRRAGPPAALLRLQHGHAAHRAGAHRRSASPKGLQKPDLVRLTWASGS